MLDVSFLKNNSLFYISPDIRRALGLELVISDYFIVCSFYDPLVDLVRKKGGNVFCLEEEIGNGALNIKNSGQLLNHLLVQQFIKNKTRIGPPLILYFKPSLKIDIICNQMGYKKLGNPHNLNEAFENKISFFQLTKEYLQEVHLPGEVGIMTEFDYDHLVATLGVPFVVQFGHGWAGKTTFTIKNQTEFKNLQSKFKKTVVKISKYVDGSTVLNNCCITKNEILIGDPATQLSRIPSLSRNENITCGREWPAVNLTKNQKAQIGEVSESVGKTMQKEGYKGYFGLDFLIDNKTGKIYLSENNARFTASVPFYTKLEVESGITPLLLHHIASFLDYSLTDIKKREGIVGSQIIIRNNSSANRHIHTDKLSGVYDFKKDKLIWLNNNYEINKTPNNYLLIIFQKKDKLIKPYDEIARVEVKDEVTNEKGQLKPFFKKITDQIGQLFI